MSRKLLFKKGQKFSDWTLTSYLGGGGNGEVWACQNSKGEKNAIKLLKKIKPKAYSRFTDETTVIEKNSEIKGIIPIIDKYLPEKLNGDTPFYVMPLGETIEKNLRQKSINEKVNAILQVAETLSELHDRKIYHRDIKPDNILFYNYRYSLVDFGLVDYPDKKEVSINNEEIGPKWTMAPEMRRESSTADGSKADVYSLAKTLWIILTENKKGFDGQYSNESIIDIKNLYPHNYTSPIDNLFISCTDNDPKKRLTIVEFIRALKKWQELEDDFHQMNLQQWFEIQTKLFPTSIPKRVIWDDINDIVKVLKIVSSFKDLNHVFFPTSGGLDLEDVRLSYEEGCIELDFQLIDIVKPKRLVFESFGDEHQWNYFRLELDNLEPTIFNEEENEIQTTVYKTPEYEDLSELSPGEYYPYHVLENRYDNKDEYYITEFSRQITRWYKGSFVIFCKRSNYNLDISTYDGQHNKMTTDGFREYIQNYVDAFKKYNQKQSIEKLFQVKKEKTKHLVEETTVYRCGWCGNVVNFDGSELDPHARAYNIKIIEKFGHSVEKHVDGYCCKGKRHQ